MKIGEWARVVHELAKNKGWWDKARDVHGVIDDREVRKLIPEKLFMVVSEVVEIGDSVRNGEPPLFWDLSGVLGDGFAKTTRQDIETKLTADDLRKVMAKMGLLASEDQVAAQIDRARKDVIAGISGTFKPEGWGIEMADVIIRGLDFTEILGVDVEDMMMEKHTYNMTRPYLHGGKPF